MKIIIEIKEEKLNDYSKAEVKEFIENSIRLADDHATKGYPSVYFIFSDDIKEIKVEN